MSLTEPPQNGEYLVAAYAVATVILVGYWLRLWRAARKSVSGEREAKSVSGNDKGVGSK
ncbi:MAG TPA: hypothetical protein VGJ36_02465 [Gemmatimonadales bacterium]